MRWATHQPADEIDGLCDASDDDVDARGVSCGCRGRRVDGGVYVRTYVDDRLFGYLFVAGREVGVVFLYP